MRRAFERWLRTAWARHGLVGTLSWLALLPFSGPFWAAVQIRRSLYRREWLETSRLPIAVVSVGNLTVGGTGKTPATVWLARELSALGYRVAVLSRGYGANVENGRAVILDPKAGPRLPQTSDTAAWQCADEPLMMCSLYGYTVGVAPKRHDSGRQLLENNPALEVFVLDDGFQHWQLARDADIVLLGSDWRGSMLPAGPFREPLGALKRADALLVTAAHDEWRGLLGAHCDPSKLFFGELRACALVSRAEQGWSQAPLNSLSGARVLCVTGIANAASFYAMLEDWNAELVDSMEFPDHHQYTSGDWHEITRRAHGVDKIITTEKDLVKLVRYPFAKDFLFALRVEMVVDRKEAFLDLIRECIWRIRG